MINIVYYCVVFFLLCLVLPYNIIPVVIYSSGYVGITDTFGIIGARNKELFIDATKELDIVKKE